MGDDAPIIYGLEFQARTLSAQCAESDIIRFFVGTQSLKFDNQIHQLEFEEENNSLVKTVYLHSAGEIWHISTSPSDPNLLSTCYNQITPDGKCEMHGALWKLPPISKSYSGDDSSSYPPLEFVASLDSSDCMGELKSILWEPTSGKRILTLNDNSFHLWDANDSVPIQVSHMTSEQKGRQKFNSGAWNPHHNCNIVGVAVDTSIKSWDLRSMQSSWMVDNAHGQLVRSIDFNPNKQYYIASCGDDCKTKFWDVRNTREALLVLSNHSHWVWCVRYNSFHDQLVLTSSSDSRVILSRAASVSSEPFGHLLDEDNHGDDENGKISEKQVSDGVISIYEEHEDSVYAVEWSSADPWLFASLSYDGRLIINKVPRAEKYRILL
ncbi:EARP-interacting protein homolog [Parasteatoda tepidariorum]|uniref:Protein TSSC1 n=1 Tax=Parasteatoda tepidariorum TaxID=114398 RepID=A0A2L2YH41_PARTP|nr:EARP-interacting protein homolog [Parasteatoda tepidariorum]XP_015930058.1 EARP-interacting protein homolog [Parasteatoda tepidariorum]XP_015930059.1 EARP-interacting protein homolog [Parasteatoda tepidariorum]XP_015930060.1 EARP-interacting protein homolog [Parasteatoda tepidariorum]